MTTNATSADSAALLAVDGGIGAVPGVRCGAVRAGIKASAPAEKLDLAVVAFDAPQLCASQITTNEIKAAPLLVSEEHLSHKGSEMRAIVANSGCANACTGARGMADARAVAAKTAELLGIDAQSVVLASTGVIGVPLPMERLLTGLDAVVPALAEGAESSERAARAIMTTDLVSKSSAYRFEVDGRSYVAGGIAKGSGMIAPSMATMLAFVATDYPLAPAGLKAALRSATVDSFNMISVDGDMSTNDCVYAFAPPGGGDAPAALEEALRAVCRDLAIAMVRDGEGATKTLTAHVVGAATRDQARTVARAIVDSNLVRTALHGGDPNWGRIIAAAGSAGAGIVDGRWMLSIAGETWVDRNTIEVLAEERAHELIARQSVTIELDLGLGDAEAVAWGCDLSHAYVDINAHYRT